MRCFADTSRGAVVRVKRRTSIGQLVERLWIFVSSSRCHNDYLIPKAACFWILGEGHSASLRAGGTACVLWHAPWFQWESVASK